MKCKYCGAEPNNATTKKGLYVCCCYMLHKENGKYIQFMKQDFHREVKMKYWDDMSEEEKSEVCRNSGCPYFFGEIDDCMCDEVERSPYDAEEKACYWLKKNYQ